MPRWLAPAMALLLVVAAGASFMLAKGSGSSANSNALPGGAREVTPRDGLLGTLALPARAAPPIELHNHLGQHVSLASYRGKVVYVTFLYTHCPDVCPLIASNLRVALNLLGPRAKNVQMIAVSVDPRGDTPAAVAAFLRAHEMSGRMQYLIGSGTKLASTWAAWNVGSSREVGHPDLVAHSALVYGISAKGTLTTIYPASFEPSEIAHDTPVLAAK